jgi:putative spermidine/putrescine transport system substrate-binding protein
MIPFTRFGACAALAMLAAAGSAQAQTKTLYIGMNGGNMEKTFTQFVFGPFEQKHNVKVVVVPGGSADILAKAQAARDKPQMHVMFLDDGVMFRAVGMGLCEKQKTNPNLASLLPAAHIKDDMATGVTISVTGLAYNTKVSSTFGLHAFLAFNKLKGGTDANVDPGFKAWPASIGPNVVEYISNSAKISEMAQTGEAALFPYTPTQSTILKSKGIPVEYVQPKEGAVVLMVAQCVIANNSEPQLAQELAAYLLSPEAQAKALDGGNYNPTNTKVKAGGASAAEQQRMMDFVKNARVVDWEEINKNRSAWNSRWTRSIER